MEYYKIKADYSPSITGKRNGGCAVELKDRTSFCSDSDKKRWKTFFTQDINNGIERRAWGSYVIFDHQSLDAPFQLCLTGKRVKQLDFMTFAPHVCALQFLVSVRVYDILREFRMQAYNAIPVKIDTFEQRYYLLGFPTIDFSYYDFTKSKFNNYISGKIGTIDSEDAYNQLFINGRIDTVELQLNTKFNVDVIHVPEGTFFSSNIIEIFESEKITGYIRSKEILVN